MPIDQEKLKKEYVFTGRGTGAELLTGLDQIAIVEKNLKAKPSRVRWASLGVFLIVAILGVFMANGFILFLSVVVPIGMIIYSAVIAASPILHNRVDLLRLVLEMLSQDAGKRGRFDVMLRLRKQQEKLSEGVNPRNAKGKQFLLQDGWLTVRGRLEDGTAISQSYVELIRQRTKRNARGKTKMKERTLTMIRVQLNYDPATYGDAGIAARRLAKPFRLPAGVQIKAFSATDKTVAIKVMVRGAETAEKLHLANQSVLLGAYRILNLARRGALSTGGTVR
jgi:hypothetical protein